jgi:hypothetical protein
MSADDESKGEGLPDTATKGGRKRAASNGAKGEEAQAKPDSKNGDEKPQEEKSLRRDEPDRVLARRAVEIAEAGGAGLGSSITAPQAKLVQERLGDKPIDRFKPATAAQLQAYAQSGKGTGRSDLPEEGLAKLREFCRETGSRRIWPRKVAALALACDELRTGRARPGTTRAKEPAAEAAQS